MSLDVSELPPRARRIHMGLWGCIIKGGTTSACAENTTGSTNNPATLGNYLRVRGEYPSTSVASKSIMELPPRARRIRKIDYGSGSVFGTTSACAENTHLHGTRPCPSWNYLRVRGEYTPFIIHTNPPKELPPRARRIPVVVSSTASFWGTTSACAENTLLL